MKQLRVGQIGIGHNHGEGKMLAVRKHPELFEVVGYAEENEEWIEKRGGLACYRDLRRMSEAELLAKCDLILVETDVWKLTSTAQRCVDAGKHVHIDKPASGTYAEFERLIHSAREKKLVVQLGYMYRQNYAVSALMEKIKGGELGEIYQIDAEMSTYHTPEYRAWLRHFRGGSMYIFGSHLIDLIVSILGEPKNVYPFLKQTGFQGVYSDDNDFAVLEYDRAIARVTTLSVEVNGWGMRRLAVMGSLGTVEIKPMELDVRMTEALCTDYGKAYQDVHTEVPMRDVPSPERYDGMMRELYLAVTGEKENPYPYDHELMVQRTICRVCGEN